MFMYPLRIRDLREDRDLSQKKLADFLANFFCMVKIEGNDGVSMKCLSQRLVSTIGRT